MKKIWRIEMLVGVGPIKLGMSKAEIDASCGPVLASRNFSGGPYEKSETLEEPPLVLFYEGGIVTLIQILEDHFSEFEMEGVSLDKLESKSHPLFKYRYPRVFGLGCAVDQFKEVGVELSYDEDGQLGVVSLVRGS